MHKNSKISLFLIYLVDNILNNLAKLMKKTNHQSKTHFGPKMSQRPKRSKRGKRLPYKPGDGGASIATGEEVKFSNCIMEVFTDGSLRKREN